MPAVSIPILFLLVPVALLLAGAGVYGFLWAVRTGQYDDVDTPAVRVLLDDEDQSDI
jgi:cbb3-type cytochrome oxidase maturation protein